MGKIKLSLIVFVELTLFIFCSEANAQSNEFNELKKAAADMIYDIAHGAISHFDIISPEETSLVFRNPRAAKRLKEDLSNKQNIQDMLSENKNDGIEAGMDWNDVTITDIRYKAEYCTDFGAEEIKGYIYVKSHGNPFRIFFKRCFFLNGKCRLIQFRRIKQTDIIESDYPLSGRNDNTFAEAEKILANLENECSNKSKDEVKEQLLAFFNVIQPVGSKLREERAKIENSEKNLNEFKSRPEYIKMTEFNNRLVELRRNNPVVKELIDDPEVVFACLQAGF